ncbi:protein NEN3-like isoform X1 [Prosopis cineraria]|uniref:protein NEN3-like isoform X1 n=1 Tax=Prosopis cineraria TaxID=364024 RepID=UPI00240F1937|nr:protein NEN3-like isoform X1 [Prosopis cineraria]
MDRTQDRSEVVFFDVETIYATPVIVEFGAILVCPETLTERHNYSTLVRPADPSIIPPVFERRNGITRDALAGAPTFDDIADRVYELLHDRIWAGHNILEHDCLCIREAFSEINRPPPEPKATIDSLPLLTRTFGRRAGDMKMASLATYFGLGQQIHRSLDDIRVNLEVIKRCAAVMFLESSFPDVFTVNSGVSTNTPRKSCGHGKSLPKGGTELDTIVADGVDHQPQPQMSSSTALSEASSNNFAVLKPHEILISSLTASLVQSYHGTPRIQLLHDNFPFQLSCADLKIRFGISDLMYYDDAGRPKLDFVVDASQSFCEVLEACDAIAQRFSFGSGSSSDWRPLVVTRKEGFVHYRTVKLRIPISECGDVVRFANKVYKKEPSGTVQKLRFN